MDKNVEKCKLTDLGKSSNFLYWILGSLCIPVVMPLVLWNLWSQYVAVKERNKLQAKVVLITGASSGLGEALAHVFYKAGCKVLLAARRLNELERVKHDLMALDLVGIAYPPTVLQLDLTELNNMAKFAENVLTIHNGVDILINNGGISVRADVISTAMDVDLKIMTVNYFGAVALTKALLPSMVKRQTGHICFINSVQGKFALPYRSAYAASKHALQAFADSLRAEIAHTGIKVTTICPGYIRTQLSVNALTASGQNHGIMDKTTDQGMLAATCAARILDAILMAKKDVLICDLQSRLAYYLRICCPSVYFWIMEKRAMKLLKEKMS